MQDKINKLFNLRTLTLATTVSLGVLGLKSAFDDKDFVIDRLVEYRKNKMDSEGLALMGRGINLFINSEKRSDGRPKDRITCSVLLETEKMVNDAISTHHRTVGLTKKSVLMGYEQNIRLEHLAKLQDLNAQIGRLCGFAANPS